MDVPVTPNSFAENSSFRAVLLGASEWPSFETLQPSSSFSNSHAAISDYLRDKLGIAKRDILDLFDSGESAAKQFELIQTFLEKNMDAGKPEYSHLIIYYSGHGDFSQERDFQLLLRETSSAAADLSAFPMKNLAQLVMQYARKTTKIVLLDCCFAAASLGNWQMQSTDVQTKIRGEAENRFTEASGTALFCACTEDDWALFNREDPEALTMFSGGVIEALTKGDPDKGAFLTVEELENLTAEIIRDKHGVKAVMPVLHVAKGMRDSIITQPLFPNPARKDMEQDVRFTELEASVEMLRGQLTTVQETLSEFVETHVDAIAPRTGEVGTLDQADQVRDDAPYYVAERFGFNATEWARLPLPVAVRLTQVSDANAGSLRMFVTAGCVVGMNAFFVAAQNIPLNPALDIFIRAGTHQLVMAINMTALFTLLVLGLASGLPWAKIKPAAFSDDQLENVPAGLRARVIDLTNRYICRVSEFKFFKAWLITSVIIVFLSTLSAALLSEKHLSQWQRLFALFQASFETRVDSPSPDSRFDPASTDDEGL